MSNSRRRSPIDWMPLPQGRALKTMLKAMVDMVKNRRRRRANCERYAPYIEEAVTNATAIGLNPSCGMYLFRTDGEYEFKGDFQYFATKIMCDNDCHKCAKESVEWMMRDHV